MVIETGVLIASIIVGFLISFLITKRQMKSKLDSANKKAEKIVDDAQKEIKMREQELELNSKQNFINLKEKFEEETKSTRAELEKRERQLAKKDENLERKINLIENKETKINRKEKDLERELSRIRQREKNLDELIKKQNKELVRYANMTEEEAKEILMDNLKEKAKAEAAREVRRIKEDAKKNAGKEAREIIISSIEKCAVDTAIDSTVSVVSLPNEELKGRIIGREGRNIRAFEKNTGIDIIVDDTPEAVILSGYNPIRREIARIALEKLISDGRIHPTRIEETVEKARKDINIIIQQKAEQVCFELGIHDLHEELEKLLGKLHFRTSYGQNVLQHSKEVAIISSLMAEELELDASAAKRAGLLHDIGKAMDWEREGTHPQLGYEVARKYGENEIILNAILSHHEDVAPVSPVSVLIKIADAISGSRPGARRESFEQYIKKLEKLENLADSFVGVEKAYAIQAGREIRVIVQPEEISDDQASILSTEIADKLQTQMEYPGQIKVTVIRETRSINYAK